MQLQRMQRGKFITFEGSEGCGKSTQIQRFVEFLKKKGFDVLTTREPGGTVVGEKIRDLLQFDAEIQDLTSESELLLFAASRAELVRSVIAPALDRGTWVVADRFLDSTTVYQGIGRGLDLSSVHAINKFAVGSTRPDLTWLLDLDVEIGHARARLASEGREDRMEAQPMDFFRQVRQGYLDLAEAEPERIAVIDASASIDEVTAAIQSEFSQRMNEAIV